MDGRTEWTDGRRKSYIPTSSGDNNMHFLTTATPICYKWYKLEDLKVLRRSPDLFNNVKIGQGQLQLTCIMKHILFYHIWGLQPFWSPALSNLMNNPSVISVKKMFR